jgi:energy-coupling factor transport system substrate-specific component
MIAAMMIASKKIMEFLPNIHLLGLFIVSLTVVYRVYALIPIYLYVFLDGLLGGFSLWWYPYLYIWTILWGMTMILPKRMPRKVQCVVYPIVCGLHGFAFGALYAPAQALMFGFDFKQMLVWISAGLPFDAIHGVANICAGLLVVPLVELLRTLLKIGATQK